LIDLSDSQFLYWIRSYRHTAFRLETQSAYAFSYEEAEFDLFCAGKPNAPSDIQWWREWLARVTEDTENGKRISRVRLFDTPLTDYQRWQIWSTPWHEEAGEIIRYLDREHAKKLGMFLNDWWLLDDASVVEMTFALDGRLTQKTLTIDPAVVAGYMGWRDLLESRAIPAQEIEVAA
jgi:hypothetical protein